ncbi:MAG: endonuclease MutS2, partial [Chitinophagales bacterium]
MNLFPQDIIEKLEFDKVLTLLETKCISELGKEKLARAKLSTSHDFIQKSLRQVHEMKSAIENGIHFPAQNYHSLEKEIKQLAIINNVLDGKQFRKIYNVINTVNSILIFFEKYPDEYDMLRLLVADFAKETFISRQIENIIDEDGRVRSNASPELVSIRRKMQSKNASLNKVFGKLVQELKLKGVLADSNESVRNNRRVLSLKAENKRTINGIIHDESDSGKTTYIEPEGTVLLNNELFELEREEKREIYRILKQLTADIAAEAPLLNTFTRLLANFDLIRAKALLAIDVDAQMPIVEKKATISLIEAKHPLLYLLNKNQQKETVPLSVELDMAQHILLISGPNAGGKSVTLKTIGLLQCMVQFGMLVPCEENSKFGIFHSIFADLGDNQSIENELSTYSSRLQRMKHFVENANKKTLYLIDEFGTGTDPRFGAAMAEAILQKLIPTQAFGIITTHYSNLKKLAEQQRQILNGAMLFDEKDFTPTYTLKTGKPGSSYTFAIAEKSGLSTELIEKAKSLVDYSDLKFDELLEKVENERKTWEKENEQIRKENKKLKSLMQRFDKLTKETENQRNILRQQHIALEQEKSFLVEKEVNAVLNKINKAKSKEVAALKAKELANHRKSFLTNKSKNIEQLPTNIEELKVNDQVMIANTDMQGEIVEIRRNKAIVFQNGMKTSVSLKDLIKIEKNIPQKSTAHKKYITKNYVESVFDIRGLMQQDSRVQLEQYIDQSLL